MDFVNFTASACLIFPDLIAMLSICIACNFENIFGLGVPSEKITVIYLSTGEKISLGLGGVAGMVRWVLEVLSVYVEERLKYMLQ